MATILIPPRPIRWTRDEYHRLGEKGFFAHRRVELIRGEVIEMSPMREPHACAIALTADVLRATFGPGFYIRSQVPLNLDPDEPEPDVAIVPGSPRDYSDTPTHALLVVEIADSSLTFDTTVKAELYATAGIADYWVLDLEGRRLLVFRDPTPLPPGGVAYRTQLVYGPADSVAPVAAPNSPVRVGDMLP